MPRTRELFTLSWDELLRRREVAGEGSGDAGVA